MCNIMSSSTFRYAHSLKRIHDSCIFLFAAFATSISLDFPRRVDEEYQGCGIGKVLTEQIEVDWLQHLPTYLPMHVIFRPGSVPFLHWLPVFPVLPVLPMRSVFV